MRVALVHDWLTNPGGAEKVVLALSSMFPDAPIYTSVYNRDKMPAFEHKDVRTSFLQHMPLAKVKHQLFPVLRARAFERFNFDEYDLVISSSSAEAKGIKTRGKTKHICYCHTPTRYYWSHYREYKRLPGFGPIDPLVRLAIPPLVALMRSWDFKAAQRPDVLLANSTAVQKRIKQYYKRDSQIIFPPVEIERFQVGSAKRHGFVMVGRQIPYKRFDLGIEAANQLKLPLTIIGDGSEHEKLKKMAGLSVRFIKNPPDNVVAEAYQKAEALIFPQDEDFGIVAVEALASGCPIIAYESGGALDIVQNGLNGVFFAEQSVESLTNAIKNFPLGLDRKAIRQSAERFSDNNFKRSIRSVINRALRS